MVNTRFLSFPIIIICLSVNLISPQNNTEIIKADEALVHANTYHWLARYKNSDSRDFIKSKQWFEKAIELTGDSTSPEAEKIREIAEAGIAESDIRYENNFDNIMNDYPLFQVLNGLNTTYEMYDDPNVVAASVALEGALTTLDRTPPREDYQMMVIMMLLFKLLIRKDLLLNIIVLVSLLRVNFLGPRVSLLRPSKFPPAARPGRVGPRIRGVNLLLVSSSK